MGPPPEKFKFFMALNNIHMGVNLFFIIRIRMYKRSSIALYLRELPKAKGYI